VGRSPSPSELGTGGRVCVGVGLVAAATAAAAAALNLCWKKKILQEIGSARGEGSGARRGGGRLGFGE
jgi:hypothetical protein